jgi:hypothetical protein
VAVEEGPRLLTGPSFYQQVKVKPGGEGGIKGEK